MDTNFKQNFALRLSGAIKEKQISRVELAEKAGIKYTSLASYLAAQTDGKGALPPLDVMVRLADTLGVTTDYLLSGRKETAVPLERAKTELAQNNAQQLLRDLYQASTALNFRTEVPDSGGVALISDNQFTRLFFEQIQRGDTLDTALGKFAGLKVSKGTLIDPVTYGLMYGECEQ